VPACSMVNRGSGGLGACRFVLSPASRMLKKHYYTRPSWRAPRQRLFPELCSHRHKENELRSSGMPCPSLVNGKPRGMKNRKEMECLRLSNDQKTKGSTTFQQSNV
jgi:hypothetical protein